MIRSTAAVSETKQCKAMRTGTVKSEDERNPPETVTCHQESALRARGRGKPYLGRYENRLLSPWNKMFQNIIKDVDLPMIVERRRYHLVSLRGGFSWK